MARLQILELPEGSDDDRPPFVFVVDQMPTDEPGFEALRRDLADGNLAERTGARAVLVFEETIDIPANDPSHGGAFAVAEQPQPDERARAAEAKLKELAEGAARLHAQLDEARQWARHGYEIGQKHCGWSDHGVAPDWLTEGWPPHIENCEHLKQMAGFDEAITRVRNLHQPVEHRGQTICWACSDYDFPGQTTDSPPVAYDQCATLRALDGKQGQR